MVCLTRGVIEETKQYMFNTTNNTCSIQKQYMFNTRHIRTWTRTLRASDVVHAQTLIGWYVCHFANWLFGKRLDYVLENVLPNLLQSLLRFEMSFEYRNTRSVAKWIAITGTLFNLNKGTQRIWRNVILFLL